jgi:hypothetical protein
MYIPYFEGAESFGISSFFPLSLPRRLDMVDKSGKMGSKMAIFSTTLCICEIFRCLLHIWALVLNSTQVYLRRQGPIRLSWACKRVRVGHSEGGWGPWAWARAWSGLCPLGFGAGSECGLGYVGHVEQVYLRRQGPNCLSWGCKGVRVWHSRGWGPRAWARAWSRLCQLGFGFRV